VISQSLLTAVGLGLGLACVALAVRTARYMAEGVRKGDL